MFFCRSGNWYPASACCYLAPIQAPSAPMSSRKFTYAIFGVFFIESGVLGTWIPRIPDIKEKLALSDGQLGLSLLALPLGTLVGLFVAAKIIELLGSLRRACQLFLPLWALSFMLPALAPNQWMFLLVLLVCGLTIGLVEVAMNTEADRLEQHFGKKIMSRCHGFWSLGSMVGALAGGVVAQIGVPIELHFMVVMPLLAVAGFLTSSQLPVLNTVARQKLEPQTKSAYFRWPSKAIVLLCVMPIGIMLVEGAFIDWSAVFMRSVLDASPLLISITYSFFSVVMAIVRLSGDKIRDLFSEQLIVQVSGIAASVGVAVFSLAPNIPVAFLGATISGTGVAIVYPLAITAAARRPGKSSADNVAAMTMISFSGFLFAPPAIGFLSELFNLRIALLCLSPLALVTWYLASEINPVSNDTDAVTGSVEVK